MGHLLLTLCLLAAAADKSAPPERQKASPTHKKRAPRAKPPPAEQPSAPTPTARTKTAMA